MLTRNNALISELSTAVNIFNDKLQLDDDKTTVEISIANTNATIKAYLKVSVTAAVFVIPHADAVIELLAGTRTIIVPFSGLKAGIFIELWIHKQGATAGTISAAII